MPWRSIYIGSGRSYLCLNEHPSTVNQIFCAESLTNDQKATCMGMSGKSAKFMEGDELLGIMMLLVTGHDVSINKN